MSAANFGNELVRADSSASDTTFGLAWARQIGVLKLGTDTARHVAMDVTKVWQADRKLTQIMLC